MYIYYSLREINSVAKEILSLGCKVICLKGEMGSGKTTFTKALLEEISSTDIGSSPSFSLVNSYNDNSGDIVAYHMDLYRLKSNEELYSVDIDYYIESDKFIFIEWPEVAKDLLPIPRITLNFEYINEMERKISIEKI